MSMYNILFGSNPSHLLLPMIDQNSSSFARYRDVFASCKDDPRAADNDTRRKIYVYTRTGGGNREEYEVAIQEQTEYIGFLYEYDDDYDSTYMTFVYEVPERWHADYDRISNGDFDEVSDKYKSHAQRLYFNELKWPSAATNGLSKN